MICFFDCLCIVLSGSGMNTLEAFWMDSSAISYDVVFISLFGRAQDV